MKGDVGGVPSPVKSIASGTGAVKLPVAVTGVPDAAAWRPTCFLCQIQFTSMEALREHEEKSASHRKNLASDVTRRLPPGVGNLRGPSASYVSGRLGATTRPPKIAKEEESKVQGLAASAAGGGVGTGTLDDPVCLCGNVDGAATESSSDTAVKGSSSNADDATDAKDEEADDDGTVSIERESSAWDRLGERFELAASAGRYIDLTDDSAGGGGGGDDDAASSSTAAVKLSASDAAAAFASAGTPVDPASVCGPPPPTMTTAPPRSNPARQPSNLRGPLRRLSNMITETIVALREVRLMLQEELQTRERRSQVAERNAKRPCRRRGELHSAVVGMNDRTKNIASFVRRHEGAVAHCPVTMGRLEDLNLVVMKANTLIAAVNGKKVSNLDSTSKSE